MRRVDLGRGFVLECPNDTPEKVIDTIREVAHQSAGFIRVDDWTPLVWVPMTGDR